METSIYLDILNYVKKSNSSKLLTYINTIMNYPKIQIINDITNGNINDFYNEFKEEINFIKKYNNEECEIYSKSFIAFLKESLDGKLDEYIRKLKILQELEINKIILSSYNKFSANFKIKNLDDLDNQVFLTKTYSDGNLCTAYPIVNYNISKKHNNWFGGYYNNSATYVVQVENFGDGTILKTLYINDFNFNIEKIPTKEELESYRFPISFVELINNLDKKSLNDLKIMLVNSSFDSKHHWKSMVLYNSLIKNEK